jgi:hypothetical protein
MPGALRVHQVRLKPALRLFEMSPAGVSLTEPATLNGPPNSFCSALSVRSHFEDDPDINAHQSSPAAALPANSSLTDGYLPKRPGPPV